VFRCRCATVDHFFDQQLHKNADLCNCWPFFESTIAHAGCFKNTIDIFREKKAKNINNLHFLDIFALKNRKNSKTKNKKRMPR
jgi:hypothetical protein